MASSSNPRIKKSWSELPIELLSVISSNLTEISDYITFRSVCSSWRSAASLGDLPPQRPRLILPFDLSTGGRSFLNLATGKLSTFDIPECRNKYVGGSAYGWLALIALDLSISLWNPITRSQIPLPPPTQFLDSPLPSPSRFPCHLGPDVPRFSADSRVFGLDHSYAIAKLLPRFIHVGHPSKVFLSSNPADPAAADCIVAVILVASRHFVYCRPGDEAWTVLPDVLPWGIVSMVFHERRMYGVDADGTGVVHDLDGGPASRPTVIRSPAEFDFDPIGDSYLLKENSEMFLVLNFGINYEDQVEMEIFRLDLNGELKWSRVKSIGDLNFFLAASHTSAVRAVQFPVCKPDSLYFSGCCFSREPLEPGVHGMEIFNVKGNDYECLPVPYPRGGTGKVLRNPTWFTPSLH